MRHFLVCVLVGALALSVVACTEEKGPAFVKAWGAINPPPSGNRNFEGDLSHASSTDYYGYCKYDNGAFEFEVGDASLPKINGVPGGLYFRFQGIKGPGDGGAPEEGALDPATGEPKFGSNYYSEFATATVASTDTFTFESSVSASCRVELFAESGDGELVPDIKKEFDYYVRISCNGMSDVTGNNSGLALQSVYFEGYFNNC